MAFRDQVRRAGGLQRFVAAKIAEGVISRRSAVTVNWQPMPGTPQERAYYSEADEVYYGGAAGGGKTDLILGLALTMHRISYVFRREAEQLSGLVYRSQEILASQESARWNGSLRVWNVAGRLIRFLGCKNPGDWAKYQGQARDFVGIDELAHFPEVTYLMLTGWNRSAVPGQRCRVVAAGNPPMDASGLWILARWSAWLNRRHANPAKPGELRWYVRVDNRDVEVVPRFGVDMDGSGVLVPVEDLDGAVVDADPEKLPRVTVGDRVYVGRPLPMEVEGDPEPVIPRSRTFIPALLKDNRHLHGTGYAAVIAAMPEPFRTMLRTGDHGGTFLDGAWQLFPSEWIEAAMARWSPKAKPEKLGIDAIGVDVARGGASELAIAPRMGNWFDELVVVPGSKVKSGPEAAAVVLGVVSGSATIWVDVGGPGSSAFDSLAGAQPGDLGWRVEAFNGAAGSSRRCKHGVMRMRNVRSAAHWHLRELLDPESGVNIALPPDEELKADLLSITYSVKPGGVIQVDPKDKLSEDTGRGFHRSDAVIMAAWDAMDVLVASDGVADDFWGARSDAEFDIGERW